jgi:GH15 family glucan-1,4-alpha-glucosidase
MTSSPIEDYGLIGDGLTAALVCRNGSIDWLCWPRFDSDACFAALLGTEEHGRWLIAPTDNLVQSSRRYQTDTLILETDFETAGGSVRLIDFMPIGVGASSVVRLVVGLRGSVTMHVDLRLRFDFGRMAPWVERRADGFVAKIGPDLVALSAPVTVSASHSRATADFVVTAGQQLPFVLSYGTSNAPEPARLDVGKALKTTQSDGIQWIGRFDKPTLWPDAVRRSLLTLRAFIHRPTGGVIAAPTTSLPEKPGGTQNWDYRFCWLRDSTFTLNALLNAGYQEEAIAWRDWILRAIAAEPAKLHIMYRVDGARYLHERIIDWLPGYRWATPVRVGNMAVEQRQNDIYGELLDGMELAKRAGIMESAQGRHLEREIVRQLEEVWNQPGQGMWESRDAPRHFTYPRVMAWVGIDRFLRGAPPGSLDAAVLKHLNDLRYRIHKEVCDQGYHSGLGTFVDYYGGQQLDASLLMLPLVGFLPADDPRIVSTVAAIQRDLVRDGFVMRKPPREEVNEGAFLPCTCWLADCLAMQGKREQAREALERVLSVRNDLGLLSEEYNLKGRHLAGNFPQALTHIAVVNTALGLSGPVLQRAGG